MVAEGSPPPKHGFHVEVCARAVKVAKDYVVFPLSPHEPYRKSSGAGYSYDPPFLDRPNGLQRALGRQKSEESARRLVTLSGVIAQLPITLVKGSPALTFTVGDKSALVVADLHLGLEDELATRGVSIPDLSARVAQEFIELVRGLSPDVVVLLGDVKHGVGLPSPRVRRLVREILCDLLELVAEVRIIKGNHDGGLEEIIPSGVNMIGPRGGTLGNLGLIHGHSWPADEIFSCRLVLAGHIHPAVRIIDPGTGRPKVLRAWMIVPWRREVLQERLGAPVSRESRVLILPAFNRFVGYGVFEGQPHMRRFGPLASHALDVERAHFFSLDGHYLGSTAELSRRGPP